MNFSFFKIKLYPNYGKYFSIHKYYYYFQKYTYIIFPDWFFPKLSPWRTDLDKFMRMLQEAGLIDHYKLETFYLTKRKYLESNEEKIIYVEPPVVAPIIMEDLLPVFYILGLGLSFSLITFLIEYLMGSIKSHKKVDPTIQTKESYN